MLRPSKTLAALMLRPNESLPKDIVSIEETTLMSDNNNSREPKIDLGIQLGGLFKNLGDLVNTIAQAVEQVEQAAEQRDGSVERKGEMHFGKDGKLSGVYGFSIRTAGGSAPRVERFGNIRPTEQGPEVAEVREPLVDLFDEGAEIVLVAEVPGVDEADVRVELHGDILALETTGARRYAKEVLLPAPGDPATLRTTYRNGILEVRLQKLTTL
jgi:HSP20 family protein